MVAAASRTVTVQMKHQAAQLLSSRQRQFASPCAGPDTAWRKGEG